jgi:AcrR family transcriptional regulator
VGRPPNPERRPQLLDEIVAYLARAGLGAVSLRPLADALGVSTYTLVYHFGDKDGVVVAALEHSEQQQRDLIEQWLDRDPQLDVAELLRRYWRWCRAPEHRALVRLAVEAITLDQTDTGVPGPVRHRLVSAWVDAIAAALEAEGLGRREARARASLVNAAVVGLLVDRMATGAQRRVDEAFERLLALVVAQPLTTSRR